MFNIFKKKELIRRPVTTKLFLKTCSKPELEQTISDLEKEINNFLKGKETVNIIHSITFEKDDGNYTIIFQIIYADETTLFQRISESINTGNFDIMDLTKNDKKGKKWFHL